MLLPLFLEGRLMKHQSYAHGTIMQGNAPEPAIANGTICDGAFRCEGHPARACPVSPDGNVLECVVVVPVLQVVHRHHPCSTGSIDQVIEGYLTCVTAANYL